jgi:anti-sigma factor RsiW
VSCSNFELRIALYVENDLAEAEARVVEAHLDACDGCRVFADEMRQSQGMLKALRAEFVEDVVFEEVRARTLGGISRDRKAVAWARYAIAAGLVLALLAGWMWRARSGAKLELQPVASMTARPPLEQVKTPPMTARIVRKHAPKRAPAFKSEPLVVKMITDDPDVVIYWLVDQNGG